MPSPGSDVFIIDDPDGGPDSQGVVIHRADGSTLVLPNPGAAGLYLASGVGADPVWIPVAGAVNAAYVGFDIVLLVGQSNMSGRGIGYDLAHLDPVDPRIFQYGNSGAYGNMISQAVEPLSMHDTPSGMGPGLVFARHYLRRIPGNRMVLVVPTAHGGTAFEGTTLTWKVGSAYPDSLYENAIAQTKAALAAAEAVCPGNNRVTAILIHQGEADATHGTSGAAYRADLDDLIDGLRGRLDEPDVPFMVGQMVPEGIAATPARQPIDAVHRETPSRKVRTGLALGPSGHQNGDQLHYDAPGQRILGRRYFEAYERALANVLGVAPPPVEDLVATQSGSSIALVWSQAVGRVTDFLVQYRIQGAGAWTTLTRAQSIDTSATITGIDSGETYEVQVAGINEEGTGTPTVVVAETVSAPVKIVGVTTGTPRSVSVPLFWDEDPVATLYKLQKSAHGAGVWTDAATSPVPNGMVAGLTPATQYDFRVIGENVAGDGPPSDLVTATTAAIGTLLADIIGDPWRAYSFARKLRADYSGPAFTVRKSSNGALRDIGFVGSVVDTADLLAFIGADSGFIVTVFDQGRDGRNLTQPSNALQARIVNAGVLDVKNGKPAAVFSGAQYYTDSSPGLYAAGAGTLLAVVFGAAQASNRIAAEGNTGSANQQYNALMAMSDGKPGAFIRNDANTDVLTSQAIGAVLAFNSILNVVSMIDTGLAMKSYVNGGAPNSVAYARAGTLTLNAFALGALVRSTVTNFFTGSLAEFAAWQSALSDSDRGGGETNMKAYFGTP